MERIVVFGPGPVFKGGIANYTLSLAKALDAYPELEVHLVSWTEQYPAIIPRDFKDRASKQSLLQGTRIRVHYLTNYNNPLSWWHTVQTIRRLRPGKVIFQWAIALQGLPLGWMAKRLSKFPGLEVVFDLHLVIQKEASALDRHLTRYGLRHAHTYITHAYKTEQELRALFPSQIFTTTLNGERATEGKTILKLFHPIYDMFQPDPAFNVAAEKARLGLREHVFLFFGFIRKYKGLHNVINAFAEVAHQRSDVSLLIVGESFWNTLDIKKWSTRLKQSVFNLAKRLFTPSGEDERSYNPLALISQLGLEEQVVVVNRFVANEEVHRYFQVSDATVLFYSTATPSGVESVAYNFQTPPLATRVGHFPETIQDGYNGYLAAPDDITSMAATMLRFLNEPIPPAHVAETAAQLSWANYAAAVVK